jgi:hypothetical protein
MRTVIVDATLPAASFSLNAFFTMLRSGSAMRFLSGADM